MYLTFFLLVPALIIVVVLIAFNLQANEASLRILKKNILCISNVWRRRRLGKRIYALKANTQLDVNTQAELNKLRKTIFKLNMDNEKNALSLEQCELTYNQILQKYKNKVLVP